MPVTSAVLRPAPRRRVAQVASVAIVASLLLAVPIAPAVAAETGGAIRITEWMYNPTSGSGEFIELTNVGDAAVDLSGWTFDDDSADPTVGFDLSGFGTVAAGESVVLTEVSADAFRTDWALCSTAKVVGGYTNNLGRADQINIFDAADQLVDRLTYGDQAIPGSIRTVGVSGWVSQAGLGADDALAWTLSSVGDGEGSIAAASGSIGSPGRSTHGSVDACAPTTPGDPGRMAITEWMYNGTEFIELTNVGGEPVDLTGWSYDDDSANPAIGFDLSGLGTVAAGVSVLVTENDPLAFRAEWDLCPGIVIAGPYSNNLGRADQINIFNAADVLVDRLTFGDQTIPGSPRTDTASAWVSVAGLGADDATAWTKSTVGDAESSYASATGLIASPGTSTLGGVTSCAEEPINAPTVTVGQPIVVGAVGDPTTPGTTLTVADADSAATELTVTATSSNGTVLPSSAVTIAGSGADRTITFAPAARGTSTVTVTVTDPDGNTGTATISFAASATAPDSSGRYHQGISDASGALDVGDGYAILINDETNTIFLHKQDVSAAPVKTWTFTAAQLGSTGEVDFEGIARNGNTVVITGSNGNSRTGEVREERRTVVTATISGSGAATELVFAGRYDGLWADLLAWDASNGHGLGANKLGFVAASTPGVLPNAPEGFNIEGLEFSPDGASLYFGFRAPTVTVGGHEQSVIVPVKNIAAITTDTSGATHAAFGKPILVDLDGRSIRAIASNTFGDYLIAAGATPANDSWALYTWNGVATQAPLFNRLLPDADLLTGGAWETIVTVPHPLVAGAVTRVAADSGDTNFYGTGETKDLAPGYQKSYSQSFTLAAVLPTWSSTAIYDTGDTVVYQGVTYKASWWTRGETPGGLGGAWQAIVTTTDGRTVWTASRVFNAGDVVVHDGVTYRAQWYTRNQKPGDVNGPWEAIVTTPSGGAVWTPSRVFDAGDVVEYQGKKYQAQWYSRNVVPSNTPWGAWKLLG